MNILDENEDQTGEGGEEGEKPKVNKALLISYLKQKNKSLTLKRRKNRRDALLNKKNRADPNAPPPNRVPLPEM